MRSLKTYREDFAQAVADIEALLRAHFKTDTAAPIPFEYGGRRFNLRDRPSRNAAAESVADAYIIAHNDFNAANRRAYFERGGSGEGPALISTDAALLDRLADALLYEELTDDAKNKMSRDEYPIMSERQEERRRDNEYEDVLAADYDATGANRAKPERRHRTEREHRFVEKLAQKKNRARKAQYKRDTAAGPVVAYNLRETGGELTEEFTQRRGIGARWLADMGRQSEAAVNEVTVEPAEEPADIYVREAA